MTDIAMNCRCMTPYEAWLLAFGPETLILGAVSWVVATKIASFIGGGK